MADRRWIVHVLGLWALAVGHPLLDLLGRSPEFFVAHRAGSTEILLLVVVLLLVVPLPFMAAVWVVVRLRPGLRSWAIGALVAALVGALAVHGLKRTDVNIWTTAFSVAAGAGIIFAVAYVRIAALRTFLTVLSIAVLAVPAAFVLQPGIRRLLLPRGDALAALPPVDPATFRPAPVILLVIDETPLVSLLDADGRIDATLYPNIAALARDGRWFRNATAVSDYTQWALPAMVTGMYPRTEALPNATDHPLNLFTLLGRTHRLEIVEAVTDLCPERLCPRDPVTRIQRLARMGSDIRYLWLHVFLTADLRSSLPPLTSNWANFDAGGWRQTRRRQRAARRQRRPDKLEIAQAFIDGISADDPQPTFYYLHTLLTHYPHELLPSGQRNATRAAVPGEVGVAWNQDEWGVAQQYQRHLLQIAHMDTIVGRLVERLQSVGLYDRALVVLTSDHGISYRPGRPRRGFTTATAAQIMRVPLIVKLPAGVTWPRAQSPDGTAEPHISDRNVETVDIAPTVAGALGLQLPWKTDGASLFETSRPERPSKRIMFGSGHQTRAFDREGPNLRRELERKLALFGGAGNPYRIPRLAVFSELAGRPVAALRVVESETAVELKHAAAFDVVNTTAAAVPFDIGGHLEPRPPGPGPIYIAVALNGTIAAVTRTWDTAPDEFLATPPLDAWRNGRNSVDVFIVGADTRGPLLRRARRTSP